MAYEPTGVCLRCGEEIDHYTQNSVVDGTRRPGATYLRSRESGIVCPGNRGQHVLLPPMGSTLEEVEAWLDL